jgi:hypothetical protein
MIYADYILFMNTIIKRNFSDINSYTEYRDVKDMYEFENGMDYMLIENHNVLIYSQMIHDIRCGNNDICSTTKAENNYEHHVNKKLTKIGFGKLYPSFCKEQAYEAFDVMYKLGRSSKIIHNDKDKNIDNEYGEREYIDIEIFNCFLNRLNDDNFNRISKCFFYVSDSLSVRTKSRTRTRTRTRTNTQEKTIDLDINQYTKSSSETNMRTPSNSPRSYVKSYISSGLQILPEEEPLQLEEEVKNEIEVKTKRSLSSSSSHTLTAISSWRTKMKHKKQKFKSFVSGMIRKKNKIGSDLHGSVEDESYKYP